MEINEERKKYRKENQIDYLKMLEFLIKSPDKDLMFKEIYNITRIHIPDIVYKYMSFTDNLELNDLKLNTLKACKVYLSKSEALNDPFETDAYFVRQSEFPTENDHLRDGYEIFNKIKGRVLQASFTSYGVNSMPMWAHYSNNHQGFCVSYDTNEKCNLDLRSTMMRVQYVDDRVEITDVVKQYFLDMGRIMDDFKKSNEKTLHISNIMLAYIIPLLSCLKHKLWSYEEELRCVTGLPEELPSYIEAKACAIHIGVNCKKQYVDELAKIADYLSIPIYIMKHDMESSSYEFIFEKLEI